MFLFYFRQAHNIDEDIPIGTSILKVKASDADSGSNADIAYSVSDDHFAVDSSGVISNNRRLDADSNNAYYEFQVQLGGGYDRKLLYLPPTCQMSRCLVLFHKTFFPRVPSSLNNNVDEWWF